MSKTLTIELPDEAFSSPEEFARELRLAAAAKSYESGHLSQERAAELAGLSRQAFMKALGRYGVSPFQTTPEELEEEMRRE